MSGDETEAPVRPETAGERDGDDWPGVFLRGDFAGPMAMYLSALLESIPDTATNVMQKHYAYQLVEVLNGCVESGGRRVEWKQVMRAFAECVAKGAAHD